YTFAALRVFRARVAFLIGAGKVVFPRGLLAVLPKLDTDFFLLAHGGILLTWHSLRCATLDTGLPPADTTNAIPSSLPLGRFPCGVSCRPSLHFCGFPRCPAPTMCRSLPGRTRLSSKRVRPSSRSTPSRNRSPSRTCIQCSRPTAFR